MPARQVEGARVLPLGAIAAEISPDDLVPGGNPEFLTRSYAVVPVENIASSSYSTGTSTPRSAMSDLSAANSSSDSGGTT